MISFLGAYAQKVVELGFLDHFCPLRIDLSLRIDAGNITAKAQKMSFLTLGEICLRPGAVVGARTLNSEGPGEKVLVS